MENKKKILHVIDSLGRGGAETLLVGVIKGLVNFDHCIVVLYNINDFSEELEGVQIIPLNYTGSVSLPMKSLALRKIINQYKPNFVHSHLFWSNVITRIACPSSIKLFFTNHSIQSFDAFKNYLLVLLERITYKKRHTLISVSNVVENDYRNFVKLKGKHFVLYNYVEDVFFRPPPVVSLQNTASIAAVAVGRMAKPKNYGYLVNNFPNQNNISLCIYGKDTPDKKLEKLIANAANKNIHYKGLSKNISTEIVQYNLFIMCSIYEGQPVSVLEAMASGLPVILSDILVMRELGGDAALYVDITNPESLSNILHKIISGKINLSEYSSLVFDRASKIAKKDIFLQKLVSIYSNS